MGAYVALLRGINVGGRNKIDMKELKALLESLGFTRVSTYLNTGNLFFDAREEPAHIALRIKEALVRKIGLDIAVLVKTAEEVEAIGKALPGEWRNDKDFKTDVAYLFDEADHPSVVEKLPVNRDYVDLSYVPGAVFWHLARRDLGKSRLNKLVGSGLYKLMTVRNVNTARRLASGRD